MSAFREIGIWWLVLGVFWLGTLTSFSIGELVTALVIAMPCAIAARAARLAIGQRWRVPAEWPRVVARVPGSAVADTAALLTKGIASPKRLRGRVYRVDLPVSDADRLAGRQILGTLAVGATPGSFVIDSPVEREYLVVHDVLDRNSPVLRAVGRR